MPYKEKRVAIRRELRARRILWDPTPLSQRSGGPHDDARGLAGCHHTPCEYGVERGEFVVAGPIIAMVVAVTFGQAPTILLIVGPLAALFASRPIAPGRGRKALTDVVECVPG